MSTARIQNHPAQTTSTEEKIRIRAYELFQKRGAEHGRALDDWLQAEAEVLQQRPQPAPPVRFDQAAKARTRKTTI